MDHLVRTGARLRGAAGLLNERRATTHWAALDSLTDLGAEPSRERAVFDRKHVAAAGISAGIGRGLMTLGRIAGERGARAARFETEYDPQPPYNAGSTDTAPADLVDELLRRPRPRPRPPAR